MTIQTDFRPDDEPQVAEVPPVDTRRKLLLRKGSGILGAAFFGIAVLLCLIAPWLPIADPNLNDLNEALRPPFWLSGGDMSHPLGTDQLGRDMMSRLLFGGRLTLVMVLAAVLLAAVVGLLVGIVAGYRGGVIDTILSRLTDAQLALPFILLALTIVLAVGSTVQTMIMVLALGSWANFARIVRGEAIGLRKRTFVV